MIKKRIIIKLLCRLNTRANLLKCLKKRGVNAKVFGTKVAVETNGNFTEVNRTFGKVGQIIKRLNPDPGIKHEIKSKGKIYVVFKKNTLFNKANR
jgi:hypothetical protein